MSGPRAPSAGPTSAVPPAPARWHSVLHPSRRGESYATTLVLGVAILLWAPRYAGPIDLRWDGGVYYILGTSLAEGKGYKLLNEPGEIEAVQYPPLLPAIVAIHQMALGTSDPTTIGRWLRLSAFLIFVVYAWVALRLLASYLSLPHAVLGAVASVCCWHAWFLSDALFPEIWFSITTILFLMYLRREGRRAHALAYVCAVASYALRTIGLAAFAVWVLDALLQRRFRHAVARGALAFVPIVAWQSYVASVERSYGYTHPAYEYQRAPYLFYNVAYTRNIGLRDPLTPEKGTVQVHRRVARNALDIPVHLGETLTASRGYFVMTLHRVLGAGPIVNPIIGWGVYLALSLFGCLMVAGGVGVQVLRGEWLIPSYVLLYLAALCLTPFPGQYLRYLVPIVPLLALLAIVCLEEAGRTVGRWTARGWVRTLVGPFPVLGLALVVQVCAALIVFAREHQPIAYTDADGRRVAYRLFFYDQSLRAFDDVVDFLGTHAARTDVVAAGTPHWIYLRTGLKAVMPPFERNVGDAQRLLDGVPIRYLVIGRDVLATERYTVPVVRHFRDDWELVFSTAGGEWSVYRRRQV
jgi:hypothetical protein